MRETGAEESSTGAKVCIYCGQDCSDKPRVRDKQGRYACRACAVAASKAFEKGGPLADDIDMDILLAPEPELKRERVRIDCPVCFREIRPGETMCVSCNYDSTKGLTEETQVGRRPLGKEGLVCINCGYDLRGLRQMRCPECNQHIAPRPEKRQKAGAFRDEATREAYVRPLLMLSIAGGLWLLWAAAASGPVVVPFYLIYFAAQVVTGVIAFFLCSALIFGFDAPWHLTTLRLAGIYAVVNLANLAITQILGGSFFLRLLLLAVFIQMLMSLLDLDLTDAIITGLVLFLLRLGLLALLVMWGMGML